MKLLFLGVMVALLLGCRTVAQKETAKKLDETVIDEVKFQQADSTDALQFLVQCIREFDEQATPKPDVSVLDDVNIPSTHVEAADPVGLMFVQKTEGSIDEFDALPVLSFTMTNVSLKEVLDKVCQLSGLTYSIQKDGEIVFERK
ncbi:hypothetical protein P3T73_08900 [Kiritimatiellota bacterium B12222]|nr:hypothetical protein P3T73_08900 [Kiritimatiellota bacterium B12222]